MPVDADQINPAVSLVKAVFNHVVKRHGITTPDYHDAMPGTP
jgi:hypothetical protein